MKIQCSKWSIDKKDWSRRSWFLKIQKDNFRRYENSILHWSLIIFQSKILFVLLTKLLSFAQKLQKHYDQSIYVQEDNASFHAFQHQIEIFNTFNVQRFLWSENFSDFNAIESIWSWLKRHTIKKEASENRKNAKKEWSKQWHEMSQTFIRKWIERILNHIQQIIRCKDDNEYRKEDDSNVIRSYISQTANSREADKRSKRREVYMREREIETTTTTTNETTTTTTNETTTTTTNETTAAANETTISRKNEVYDDDFIDVSSSSSDSDDWKR